MTRLASHQQREFKRKLTTYVVLVIALIILLTTFGLKFLINSSIFIGSIGNKNQTATNQQDDSFFGDLDISDVPEATNSAQIIVSGSATDFDNVDFYLNDKKVKTKALKDSTSFDQEIGDLKTGINRVYLQALTKDKKHQKTSDVFTVVYKNEKPKLDVKEPSDGSKTNNSEITVSGETDADVTVRVNNSPVVVNAQNQFRTTVQLHEGDNTIVITAEDNAGNSDKRELKVSYQKD